MAIPKKLVQKPAEDVASNAVAPKKPVAVTPKKPVVAPKKPVVATPKKPVVTPKKPVATTPTPAAVALARAAAARAAAAPAAAPVVKHVWTKKDTYADLAFKHYGSIKEPYWRLIYEHNKAIIGDHPNNIRVGLEIEIPPLPDELKKK